MPPQELVCVCAYVFVPRVLARGVEGRSSDRACVCVCSCTEEFRLRRRLQRRPGCYSGGYTTAAARPRPPACYTTAPNRTGDYTTFSAAHTTPKVTAVRGRHSRPGTVTVTAEEWCYSKMSIGQDHEYKSSNVGPVASSAISSHPGSNPGKVPSRSFH